MNEPIDPAGAELASFDRLTADPSAAAGAMTAAPGGGLAGQGVSPSVKTM